MDDVCRVARRGGTGSGGAGWSGAGMGEEWTREARVVTGFETVGWDMERCVVDREAMSTSEVRRLLVSLSLLLLL